MEATYLGATEMELRNQTRGHRMLALINQRWLFPHHGRLRLESTHLVLEGWRVIPKNEVVDVQRDFTATYGRLMAAGIRGSATSFGIFSRWGKPLVLELQEQERLYLLIEWRWLFGTSRNREWERKLQDWLREEP